MKRTFSIAISALASFIIVGCGPSAEELTNDAWKLYEQERFAEALQKFNEAIAIDASYADAYNGQGWCYAELDSLAKSITAYTNCLNYDNTISDAYAGLSLVYADSPDDLRCIDNANALIQREPNYIFSHKRSVTIEDVRLVKAKACCNIGDFETALSEIQKIDASFNADPDTPEGQQAILVRLEELIEQYR